MSTRRPFIARFGAVEQARIAPEPHEAMPPGERTGSLAPTRTPTMARPSSGSVLCLLA
jgi:hypothetical protein